ncbi:MAG: wax ester/triacylglycerol synthase family O-acyltransferase [Anaerolineales bacterium]|nr:wax ester/triacylglycerol synthase family O-acyltransferase [Anaerolineales bacterium]
MASKPIPMSSVDAAWYHMDNATNLAMVSGVILTREPLDFARVKETYLQRLASFDRFRQCVVETGAPYHTPHWETYPYFNIDDHVHHVALPEPRDKQALLALLSDLSSTPLDPRRPLWQVHVVDDVDGGSALVMRFHHCVGDGTAMIAVAQQLFDTTPDAPIPLPAPKKPASGGMLDAIFRPARRALRSSTQLLGSAVEGGVDLVRHPSQVLDLTELAARSAGSAAGLLLKSTDPVSPIKGQLGVLKRVAWSEPIALDEVKEIGKRTGAKVNDVLVAVVSGALRRYLLERHAELEGHSIRAIVPVDLRPPGRAFELGNHFGLVFLELPVGFSDPFERLGLTKRNMDALKQSPEAHVLLAIIDFFGRTPKSISDIAVNIFTSKASVVMTNVAGPREPRYLAGSAIDRMIFWVPHPGSIGMGISILSYNGGVSLGIIADAGLVPDPEHIAAEFDREFQRLLAAVRVDGKTLPAAEEQHCAGRTVKGQPCRNHPLAGSTYCRVHQPETSRQAAKTPRKK